MGDENKPDATLDALSKITDTLTKQGEAIASITERMSSFKTPAAEPAAADDEGDISYEGADEGVKKVADAITPVVTKTAQKIASQIVEREFEQERTIKTLQSEYPELKNKDHAMTKEALRIFKSLPQDQRTSFGMKYAAMEAASQLGVLPVSKRENQEDDTFVVGGGNRPIRPAAPKEGELNDEQAAWAESMGLDPKRVAARATRTNWIKYGPASGGKR